MFTRYAVLPSVIVCLVLAACSETPLAETPRAPETALTTTATSPYTTYHWYPGRGTVPLLRTSEGFCWLAGVEGRFDSAYSSASVRHEQGRWYLEATNSPNTVKWAGAECIRWSAIKTPNASQRKQMFSNLYTASAATCVLKDTETWWGDAATMLTGVSGNLTNSSVHVLKSPDGFRPSKLSASGCSGATGADKYVRGQAHSVFVGDPGTGNLPEFWAPGGKSGGAQFYVNTNTATSNTVEMAPTDQAFCYLIGVGGVYWSNGAFNSAGDWVWLHRGKNSAGREVWKLNVQQVKEAGGIGFNYLWGRAVCYSLTQY